MVVLHPYVVNVLPQLLLVFRSLELTLQFELLYLRWLVGKIVDDVFHVVRVCETSELRCSLAVPENSNDLEFEELGEAV
jgi:hypothetical protein